MSHAEATASIDALPDITVPLLALLRDAVDREDWRDFNSFLFAAGRRPSRGFVPLLTDVLDRHHEQVNNEDLMDVLAEIRDPAAVDALERALLWEPDWDEYFHLAQKAIWALGAIGTPAARQVLDDAVAVGPERVRGLAADELAALDRREERTFEGD